MKNEKLDKHIREFIPFLELVSRYEEINYRYPWENDYFRLDRLNIADSRRFEKVIFYLEKVVADLKWSQARYNKGIQLNRWNSIKNKIMHEGKF